MAVGWVWAWKNWGDRPGSIVVLAGFTLLVVAVLAVARARQRPGLGALAIFVVVVALAAALVALVFPEPREDACGVAWESDAAEVLVVWDAGTTELGAFCETVAAYGGNVVVTTVGDDIGNALEARFASGDVPELAIVPQPNLVRRYAARGLLCPVADELTEPFPDEWRRLVEARVEGNSSDQEFGVFVKGAHKSIFWYDAAIESDEVVPSRWSRGEMRTWLEGHVGDPAHRAPLALPAGDRWPLTDWFENELASRAPDLYAAIASLGDEGEPTPVDWDDPATGEQLRAVLGPMYDLWATDGLFAGDPADTTWQGAAEQVATGQVALAFGPSFMAGEIGEDRADDVRPMGFPGTEPVPSRTAGAPPLVGDGRTIVAGGDIAVVPELPDRGCPAGRSANSLLGWLTGDGMATWAARDSGFLTPHERSPALVAGSDAEPLRYYLTRSLREAPDVVFDLSDNQFALANDGDPRGTWDIFGELFAAARSGGDRDEAIECVVVRLAYEYRGAPWPAPCERPEPPDD